ncbi:hypothetical protein [Vitiosangium sp. GDMCC 1.1324]|uniref:monooxygenase n=1 Tax=Vitiosangium sp. (strain GDMCC 1.1324) TaxID=2138576 RepID=UPI00130DCEBD|nr:hypothetical protein [Vitiosangium sp. GDMCC 1.1324]
MLVHLFTGCSPSPSPPPPATSPTFSEHVAPIIEAQCVSCHREGGVAPFRLDSYAGARDYAQAIKAATSARTMPPWGVESDGSCNTFRDARWLSDEQIDTIARWVDAGAPEGAPGWKPQPVASSSLGAGALELAMSAPYTPAPSEASTTDDYRCFLLDPKLDESRFITGFEVLPGNTALVHHALVYSVDPAQVVGQTEDGQPITNGQRMEALQKEAGPKGGWPCFGAAGEGVTPNGLSVTWAPGTGVTHYPEGTGLALAKGHQLVMQMHYHLHTSAAHLMHEETGGTDQTRLRLELTRSVARPAISVLPDEFLNTRGTPREQPLPPGQAAVPVEWTIPGQVAMSYVEEIMGMKPSRIDVYGVFPHMHGAGRELSATFEGKGTSTCAAQVSRWDYNWQRTYFYETPLSWTAEQSIHVKCTYDTRGYSKPIRPGLGTEDEMCLFGLYMVPVP